MWGPAKGGEGSQAAGWKSADDEVCMYGMLRIQKAKRRPPLEIAPDVTARSHAFRPPRSCRVAVASEM